ncbi:thiol reductant ABC exporter subunit CydD [Aliidiomarina maris]|uniref:ATP-binding cassette subfamily C protein CydD n=1 Tax=Aliidiomarina maris TaxID=531312 RepID=A0A327X0E8_9GAMM|nr:thiol reductant ABC exporter subunit CydD [Aliidiomarina maris]RAJ98310.1 ATP-binding cassette subfamily C protein CydD [Aliidiomarina maris]RUO24865.1 thiol reductant ABC exporter subunit CydD [Aliidiomarina maris]
MNQQAQAGAKQYLAALTQQLRGLLRQARFAGALHGALQVASIIALAVWVSLSVEHAEIQWVWLPVIVILLGLRWLAANWASATAHKLGSAAQQAARAQLLKRWAEVDPVRPQVSTERANLMVEPSEQLFGYFARFLPQLSHALVIPLLILVVVAWLDWIAALFLLFAAPIIPIFMALVGMGAARLNERHIHTTQRLAGLFVDRVRYLTNLKLFGAETRALSDIEEAGDVMRRSNMATLKIAFLSSAVLEFFAAVAIAAVAIYVGFSLLGYFTFGPAASMNFVSGLTILLLAPEFFQPLRNLSAHYHDRAAALAAAGLLQVEQQALKAGPEAKVKRDADSGLHLTQVSFGYRQKPVIADFSWPLQGGQIGVLNGPSGSGKTTLLKLLTGQLLPQHGCISIPNSSHIAYMAQEPYVLAGSIADNLRLVRQDASNQTLQQALSSAGLDKPLDTMIGEQGQGLSGGELRRLALARMVLHPSPLMIFDEPTAGLDAATSQTVLRAINELRAPGRVIVICSHDPAVWQLADSLVSTLKGPVEGAHI